MGLGTGGSHRRENRLALDSVRLYGKASDAAIKVICKGKVIKPKSIQWNVNQMKVQ